MNQAKISVIIPIYNVENYLNRCIESVVNQTYKNLEIILVDDGSPDNCPKICDNWAQKDNRIKVIHKTNGGLSDARNAGLEIASGDYIAFLDSDDYIDLYMYEKLYKSLQTNNSDISMCGFKNVYDNSEKEEIIEELNLKKLENESIFPYLLKVGYIKKENSLQTENIMGNVWRLLYSKEIIGTIRFIKNIICEDLPFNIDIFEKKPKVSVVNEPLYCYVQRSSSIVHAYNEQKIKKRIEAYKLIVCKLENKVKSQELYAYKFYLYSSIVNELLKHGHRKKVKKLIKDDQLKDFNTKQNYILAKKSTNSFKYKIAYFFIRKKMFWLYSILLKFI